MEKIEKMLRETIGLDAASVGSASIQRLIRLRMKGVGVSEITAYRELLSRSRMEWDELVEEVVVTETWFFRDSEAFGIVVDAARAIRPSSTLRVLTVPCSSGEEPYSLAIALKEAGISAGRVQIEAADISARALARARNGVYGRNSFRGKDIGYRERYFHKTKEGFVLHPEIRSSGKFVAGNILDPHFAGQSKYDFIFCRNLLIYFDGPTRRKTLEKLDSLLSPVGVLFVGPAEQPLALEYGFISANLPKAFACRKAASGIAEKALEEEFQMPAPLPASCSPSIPSLNSAVKSVPSGKMESEQSKRITVAPDLEMAKRLADTGRLQDAADICERYLGADSDSAQGWYLLGLIRDASGNSSAVDCYRKALYLKPDHYESLLQMAFWLQKNGNSARARTFKARAERVKSQMAAGTDDLRTTRHA